MMVVMMVRVMAMVLERCLKRIRMAPFILGLPPAC